MSKQQDRNRTHRHNTGNRHTGQYPTGHSTQRRRLSEEERRRRIRKRRRKRLMKKLLMVVLLFIVAFCGVGIVYFGKDMLIEKMEKYVGISETDPDASAMNTDISGMAADAESAAVTETTEDVESVIAAEPTAIPEPTATPVPEKIVAGDVTLDGGYEVYATEETFVPDETEVTSPYSILIDLSSDRVVASKNADTVIYPASMTKILTVLVAAEHVTNLDDTFTVTGEMTNYCLTNGCSAAGFWDGEVVKVRDLFYGTILPSGGEAAVALATYVAGSHEAFVELMNQKISELGLSDTAHFTNCVGIFDENNYCTVTDMAMILKAALANDWAREVLSTKVHTTDITPQNPEGIVLSNWFLRRIEDKDSGGTVVAAKTGYVAESGNCAASYEISAGGVPYICVTVGAHSDWRCIYDHVAMYRLYAA